MSPHSDAPSPAGSYTAGFNRIPFRPPVTSSLMTGQLSLMDSHSPLSSSYGSTSEASDFHVVRPLLPGVYVPTMCFFKEGSEDVDTDTIARHAVRLARAGVTGLATQGSNGEAVHLTHAERQLVTATTRKALNDAGFPHMPIIVGCGAQSTRETIQLCREAWAAGGDYALVLPPSYYASLFAPGSETIIDFFTTVADASPIPIIIYNFPGAVGGLDLSSDVIIRLAEHPNIVGVKLTCGNTGKLSRVAAATRNIKKMSSSSSSSSPPPPSSASSTTSSSSDIEDDQNNNNIIITANGNGAARSNNNNNNNNNNSPPDFLVLAGSADFTIQALVAGGHGILAGLANVAPRACVRLVELFRQGTSAGGGGGAQRLAEAQALQEVVARGDWAAIQGGVVGVKAGLQGWLGYGGHARSPLPRPTAEQARRWKEGFRELIMLEKSL